MSLKQNRSFKIIFLMGAFTNIGDSLFFIISMWYVANSTDVAIYAGMAGFLFTLPEALLIFTGPFIDKVHPKRILAAAAFGQLVAIGAITLLFLTGQMEVLYLLPLLFLSACCSAITYPVEETVLPQIVKKEELVRANSWFSVAYKLSDSLFDSIAGLMLVAVSVSFLYQLNFVIFLLPLILLKFFTFPRQADEVEPFRLKEYRNELKDGFRFVMNSKLKWMVAPLAVLNFFTALTIVALPYFSNELSASPSTYGFLLGAAGIGSMTGALLIGKMEQVMNAGRILTLGVGLHGVLWGLMTFSQNTFTACVFIFFAHVCMGGYNVIYASFIQSMTPKHLLGRVNTTVDSVITIAMPVGALAGGVVLGFLPVRGVMLTFTAALILTSFFYLKTSIDQWGREEEQRV
ncbi:MFS transporter [Halobacillus litoralis]|uniref:MFS transporter n=1 Tax=Halobacillus litoralis TaxID=45668 RepID=UPI001CD7A106|nr:MFS transporter [Halobacillus litoralis]MCA0969260.1 MFS transporter [Halobacillus litoralis]